MSALNATLKTNLDIAINDGNRFKIWECDARVQICNDANIDAKTGGKWWNASSSLWFLSGSQTEICDKDGFIAASFQWSNEDDSFSSNLIIFILSCRWIETSKQD